MLDLLKFDISARNRAVGEMSRLKRELGGVKGALAGVSDYARRAGRSMRNIGAGLTAGLTAPLVLFTRDALRLYDQQVKAEEAVATAIRSTGGAAGYTLAQLKGMASALQGVTTFGDEEIMRDVTAPLLTFTKVQGEVFDRAQANVLDMATLLQMDLKSAAILVGKALNDPIKGISALGRSGVQFSDEQKAVIAALVETGEVAKAQGLILEELETQFKGQAEAAANTPLGQWKQLGNAIGDVKEQLGKEIVPFLVPLAEQVKAAIGWFAQLSPEAKKNIVIFGGMAAAIGPIVASLGLLVLGIGNLAGAFRVLGAVLMANPIIGILALIAGAAAIIYRNWDGISAWFSEKWAAVKAIFSDFWAWIKGKAEEWSPQFLKDAWGGIAGWFGQQWAAVNASVRIAWGLIRDLFNGEFSVTELIHNAWSGIGGWFRNLWDGVVAAFRELWGLIRDEVSQWPQRMIQFGRDMLDGFIQGLNERQPLAANTVSNIFLGLISTTQGILESRSPSKVFEGIGNDVIDGLTLGIKAKGGEALDAMRGVAAGIVRTGKGALDFLGSVKEGAKTLFREVLFEGKSFRDSLSNVLGGLGGQLINKGIDLLFDGLFKFSRGGAFAGGRQLAFATGGVIDGPTMFPMRGGTGLMGEAGPEAIMPLTRIGGKLGVAAEGGGPQEIHLTIAGLPEGATIEEVRGVAQAEIRNAEGAIVQKAVRSSGAAARTTKAFMGL